MKKAEKINGAPAEERKSCEEHNICTEAELKSLDARALRALRGVRDRVNGNLTKTRMTCAAVDEEHAGAPDDSRVMSATAKLSRDKTGDN